MAIPSITVIAPARDERDNVEPLVDRIETAMSALGREHEIIIVDDGSTDGTREVLIDLLAERSRSRLRALVLEPGQGQSAALCAGIAAARGALVVTLDADLQNDPGDIPLLVRTLEETGVDVVLGDRSRVRQDTASRRIGSAVARFVRRVVLGDPTRDTGCTLRVMRREVALALPLDMRGMHRFIPYFARRMGFSVRETPVAHGARVAGRTKYGMLDRALVGLVDCLAVRWMMRRLCAVEARELPRADLAVRAPERSAEEAHT